MKEGKNLMIAEYLIKIFVILTLVAIIQTSYNIFIYRQVGKLRWGKFLILSISCVVVGGYLLSVIKEVTELPYLKGVFGFIDSVIFSFFSYISSSLMVLWFVVPILIVWIIYLLKSISSVIKNRIKFNQWENQNKDNMEPMITAVGNDKAVKEEKPQEVTVCEPAIEEKVHFLENVEIVEIRFDSILGLQRAYEVSKKKGLQIGETESGYVAVYSSKEGMMELEGIFNKHGIERPHLGNDNSLVFFNKKNTKSLEIRKAMDMLRAGEKID